MATTQLDIANLALTAIGTRNILSMDEQTKDARACKMHYDDSRKSVLRLHPWNFAIKRAILNTVLSTAPTFGYTYAFPLPDDFSRVHTVYDADANVPLSKDAYRVEGLTLVSDYSTLHLKYVSDEQDVVKFDQLFVEAVAYHLAARICYLLTGSDSMKERLTIDLKSVMQKARFVDSVEDPSEELDADVWCRSRVSPASGFVRDPMT
jgi:hypothetical protein